jgi:quinol monooxygenase YgiN
MSVIVTMKARLRDVPDNIQKLHDQVTAATKDQAIAAGDVGHKIYLSPQDPKDFLGIDAWQSFEAFQRFSSDPKIAEFFGQLFEGRPEITVWSATSWNQW